MNFRNALCLLFLLIPLFVWGCSSEEDSGGIERPESSFFALEMTYPYQGMHQVPVTARVHLVFNAPFDPESIDRRISFCRLLERGGTESVDYELQQLRQAVVLKPEVPLRGGSQYRVKIKPGIRDFGGRGLQIPGGKLEIMFDTRPDRSDSLEPPSVELTRPEQDGVLDVSTLRVYFNEPIDTTTLIYGENVHLRVADPEGSEQGDKADDDDDMSDDDDDDDDDDTSDDDDDDDIDEADEPGELVHARMFAQGNQVVIDPLYKLNPRLYYEFVLDADPLDMGDDDDDDDDDDDTKPDDDDDDDQEPELPAGVHDLNGSGMEEPFVWGFYPRSTGHYKSLVTDTIPTAGEGATVEPIDPDDLPISMLTGWPVNSLVTQSKMLGESPVYLAGMLFTELGDAARAPDDIPIVISANQGLVTTSLDAKLGGEIPAGLISGRLSLKFLTDVMGNLRDSGDYAGQSGLRPLVTLMMDASLTAEDPIANSSMAQSVLGSEMVGISYVRPSDGVMVMELLGYSEINLMGERLGSLITLYKVPPDKTPSRRLDTTPPRVMSVLPMDEQTMTPVETPVVVVFNEAPDPVSAKEKVQLRDAEDAVVETEFFANGAKIVLRPVEPLEPYAGYNVFVDAGLVDIAGNESTSTWGSTFATNYAGWSEYPPRMGSMVPPNEYGSTFPCNLNPTVYFTQVMNPDTFWYGYTVSIYDLDSAELVPATLQVDWRKMVIVPDEPLEPSRRYRLEITDELRSVADRPLDTNYDYLAGGGPFWRDWVATGPSSDIVLFLTATPIADTDGNGYYDYDESPAPQNQIEILSELVMWPSYVSGEMISYVRGLKYDANDQPYLDIELSNGIVLFATSTTMGIPNIDDDDDDFDDDDFDRDREKIPGDSGPLGMGPITIDVFEPGSAPVVKGMDGQPQMNISMNTYFTVGNGLINALLVNELGLEQTGRLYFAADGRMEVIITGRADIELLGGVMALPSEVTMRAVSEPQY